MHRWWKRPDAGKGHGRVTLRFDDETPYVIWFDEEIRRSPAEFDRFGLFNIARFGTRVEMYLGDLTVNGQKLDLSQDPHWEGRNNESRYTEPNFHAMHSYGWSQTNWAGEKPGRDRGPVLADRAARPALLVLRRRRGRAHARRPDLVLGHDLLHRRHDRRGRVLRLLQPRQPGRRSSTRPGRTRSPRSPTRWASPSPTARRWATTSRPRSRPRTGEGVRKACEVFTPDRRRRRFTFDYDPEGNGGTGRVTVTLDGQAYVLDLTPQQRKARRRLQPLRAGQRPQRRPFGRVLPGRRDLHGPSRARHSAEVHPADDGGGALSPRAGGQAILTRPGPVPRFGAGSGADGAE